MVLEPGKIACHLEGSRASSLVTRGLTMASLELGHISIKRVHCVSYVLVSGVCVRRELVFPYVSIVIMK